MFFSLWVCDTQYDTDQTAVSTVHMITILTSAVQPLSVDNGIGRESGEGVECKLYIIIIQFWDFTWYSVVYTSLQNQYIAMLHSSVGIGIGYWYGIARGQYYWILDTLFGIVLTLVTIKHVAKFGDDRPSNLQD